MSAEASTSSTPEPPRASSESPARPPSENFKGRSARKSTAAKPLRDDTPDFDCSNSSDPELIAALKAQRALDNLQFSNPGQKNSDLFSLSAQNRRRNAFERAKDRTATEDEAPAPSKPAPAAETDICDCIRPECNGCFPKCKKCGSRKCGRFCQVNRNWTVVEAVIPGCDAKPRRNDIGMEFGSGSDSGSSDDETK